MMQCQLTRMGKCIEVTKIIVPVEMSLIQVPLWIKFLLESLSWLVEQQPTNVLEKSHISSKIYSTSEGLCEVQI